MSPDFDPPPATPRRPSTHQVGVRYEGLAARWLEARGWRILERNVRHGRKEVDLVARRDGVIAFVEVKARRGPGCGHPLEAVTRAKRREIEAVARWWVARGGGSRADRRYRFDVLAVVHLPGGVPRLEHVEDAWRLGE